jgi:hypothetical protein
MELIHTLCDCFDYFLNNGKISYSIGIERWLNFVLKPKMTTRSNGSIRITGVMGMD